MIRNKNLVLFISLFGFLSGIVFILLQKLLPLVTKATYYCGSFVGTHIIPIPYYLCGIPIMGSAVILAISFFKLLVLLVRMHLFQASLVHTIGTDQAVVSLVERLGLTAKTIVVDSAERFAFCLGLGSPKIYVSTGLLAVLSATELEAVLRHEQYHLEKRDTITLLIASIAQSLFPFFPILTDLIRNYRIEREIKADQFAVSFCQNPAPLISTLRKFLFFPAAQSVAFAAIADTDTLEPRICALLGKPHMVKQFGLKNVVLTVASVFIIGTAIATPLEAKQIQYQEQTITLFCTSGSECMNQCTSEQTMNKFYSELPAQAYSSVR